jgi:probable rRNA maturation factor
LSEETAPVIEVTNDTALAVRSAAVRELVAGVLSAEGAFGGVTVAFVSSSTVAELNNRYRSVDSPTDVLSFGFDGEEDDWPQVDDEEPYLGDVVLCPDVAAANAAEYDDTLDAELRRLLVHGVLHLLGYDHECDDGEMQRREDALLEAPALVPLPCIVDDHAS